ncbi:MAG: metal-dependent hydrolase [Rhodocyclales bacterium RIFCSPLOWO2_02_FULL_63_24]|nr:MAG: metal-dependent hydrolase [Rhodocyclales bacterium GWA2_65_19]OHC69588.1 MAG: metal-dependent hydrolase [Rhodocyclales bacterium RIFCSPLOWO2_02_FULL_63_24]
MTTIRQEIVFGTETIVYEVRLLPSRRTLGIEVHPDMSVIVRAPADCDPEIILARVGKRASWISRQLANFQRYSPRTPARQYVSGETHLYLGRQYRLKVGAGETASVKMNRGHLLLTLPGKADPGRVQALLHRWYLDHARQVFSAVLDAWLPRIKGHQRPRLIVRAMQSRWGSLSQTGTMTLNSNLIRAPRACIEYVVVHELCHLKHRDHDAGFFRLLVQVMPDWEKRKQRLETALL